MFRSPSLEPAQIDYLYSELVCLVLVRPSDQRKRHRTMRTQLHQIVADIGAPSRPTRPR